MSYSGSVGRHTIGSLGSSEDSTNGSLKKPKFSERHPKVVRSLTVVAYIFSVSLVAILLSGYYVVFWTPKPDDPKQAKNNSSNLPCREVTYSPDGQIHVTYPRVPVNRYTQSSLRTVYRPPSLIPPLPPPAIPMPNKLFSYLHTSQNNSSLAGDPPLYEHDGGEEQQQKTSGLQSDYVIVEPTTTVSPPIFPTPNSIIMQKILTNKKGNEAAG